MVAALLVASPVRAAAPLVELDFNDDKGAHSLVSRGTLPAAGALVNHAAYAKDTPPADGGGFSGAFAGAGDRVDFGGLPALHGLVSFTIAGWVKLAPQTDAAPVLVRYAAKAGGPGFEFGLSGPASARS